MTKPQTLWRAFADFTAFVVFEAHVEPVELWTAGNAFVWGIWLANPLFVVFQKGFYLGMAQLAPESAWGLFAATAAVVQIYGRLTGRPSLITLGGQGIAALWIFAAGALAVQNWHFATTVMYPMIAILSLFVSWRAAVYPYRVPGAVHGKHT